jgi:hypothetical protein
VVGFVFKVIVFLENWLDVLPSGITIQELLYVKVDRASDVVIVLKINDRRELVDRLKGP